MTVDMNVRSFILEMPKSAARCLSTLEPRGMQSTHASFLCNSGALMPQAMQIRSTDICIEAEQQRCPVHSSGSQRMPQTSALSTRHKARLIKQNQLSVQQAGQGARRRRLRARPHPAARCWTSGRGASRRPAAGAGTPSRRPRPPRPAAAARGAHRRVASRRYRASASFCSGQPQALALHGTGAVRKVSVCVPARCMLQRQLTLQAQTLTVGEDMRNRQDFA